MKTVDHTSLFWVKSLRHDVCFCSDIVAHGVDGNNNDWLVLHSLVAPFQEYSILPLF